MLIKWDWGLTGVGTQEHVLLTSCGSRVPLSVAALCVTPCNKIEKAYIWD